MAYDIFQFVHARLQPPADPVRQLIHHLQHLALLLELPAHIVRLSPQVPYRLEHPVQMLVLVAHQLHLLLLLEFGRVVVAGLAIRDGKRAGVGEIAACLYRLGKLGSHVLDLAPRFLHHPLPPCDFGIAQAEPRRVVLDCFDGLD